RPAAAEQEFDEAAAEVRARRVARVVCLLDCGWTREGARAVGRNRQRAGGDRTRRNGAQRERDHGWAMHSTYSLLVRRTDAERASLWFPIDGETSQPIGKDRRPRGRRRCAAPPLR